MNFSVVAAGAASLLLVAAQAHAAVPTVTVNEFGVATYTDVDGSTESLTYGIGSDPGAGGKSNVLRYSLPISAPTAGDVQLLVPPGGPGVSEVIRFGPGTLLFFYSGGDSADTWDSLADVGLPGEGNNTVVGVRGTNTFTYTPTIGQPGFDPGGFIVTYKFVTEPAPVPEPMSLGLLGLGGAALLVRRRKV